MSQKPLLAFAITLIFASSGCLGFGDDELEQQENDDNEKQEPVGETNMTSLEKRISDLEATIVDYEQPRVYFMEFNDNDSYSGGLSNYYVSDLGGLLCIFYNEQKLCSLYAMTYDINGIITSYSWEGSETDIEASCFTIANSDPVECYAFPTYTISLEVCQLEPVDQTLMLRVYDNDGNSASASYDLDYDSVCTVEEPDNTCATNSDCPPGTLCIGGTCVEDTTICVDGESMQDGGMIWSCIEGEWEAMASIVCGSNEFVSNHTCVPCPEGTTNEAGDPAPHSDTTCDENEPPIIWSFTFVPGTITNETSQFGTSIDAEDPENDTLSVSAVLLLNGQEVYSVYSEDWVSFILDISEYDIVVGDELSVIVTVMDSLGQSTTATHTVVVEESE